ncbi:aromatic ring-hydroxylating dioxygenase subunit alpha [Sphingorhabdus sp.]|jgi:phenylpropionate dioxygenase-like ring-hydroxylating dioxygenase large terminal subunit|uniref:aromatic ring-hydroxylating dioxygenase subunit alpha n=1 Tax=Sphingorhabdus sp. TaxID=1902408 RepID=UPI0037C6504F
MTDVNGSLIPSGSLVDGPRVHGSVYRNPDIFQRELERIWYKVWVYVGHESEVPNAGDFVRRQIGLQPVLMVRGDDGKVRVFYNRCRHRANLVCLTETGNAEKFVCPYHAWSYANTGELLEPTFDEGYNYDLDKSRFPLVEVARQDSYRGLMFASVAPEGITLTEHLGPVSEFIDMFMGLSPEGEITLDVGCQKVRYKGNWKYMPENSMEGDYHGPFIHKIAFELYSRSSGLDVSALHEEEIPDVIRSLPGGHMVEDYRGAPLFKRPGEPSAARKEYAAKMIERHGEKLATQMMGTMAPLLFVFPNMMYVMTHIRTVQPVSVGETNSYYYPVMLKGVPGEINAARLSDHQFMFGSAGFVSPDDVEIMERNQIGMKAVGDDWLFIGRGEHRERDMPDGGRSGFTMDETHLRGFWRHYASLMEGGA